MKDVINNTVSILFNFTQNDTLNILILETKLYSC